MSYRYASFTWGEFQSLVMDLITVDADVAGIEKYRPAQLRLGVLDLQMLFEDYRKGHETLYRPEDLVMEGFASKGVKPPESAIKDVYLVNMVPGEKNCHRFPVAQVDWKDRFAMIHGGYSHRGHLNSGAAFIAIDPEGYEFYIYPGVYDCWVLSMYWSGFKLDFKDDEETPFDEAMAGAVSLYLEAQIARQVDHDLARHDSYLKSFAMSKPKLAVALKEKREIRSVGAGSVLQRCMGMPAITCECGSSAISAGSGVDTQPFQQQLFNFAGDPNGHILAGPLPAWCIDTVGQITWTKNDGIRSNTGWH